MRYTCIIAFTGSLVGSSNPVQQSSPPIQSTIQSSDQRRPTSIYLIPQVKASMFVDMSTAVVQVAADSVSITCVHVDVRHTCFTCFTLLIDSKLLTVLLGRYTRYLLLLKVYHQTWNAMNICRSNTTCTSCSKTGGRVLVNARNCESSTEQRLKLASCSAGER